MELEWTSALKYFPPVCVGIPESSTCQSFRPKLRGQTEKENTKSYERKAWQGRKRAQNGRRRWKEKKGGEGWAVCPRLYSTDV